MLTAEFYDISLWVYLLIFVTVFVGSVIDALVGGGGLITIPTYLICGLPPKYRLDGELENMDTDVIMREMSSYPPVSSWPMLPTRLQELEMALFMTMIISRV